MELDPRQTMLRLMARAPSPGSASGPAAVPQSPEIDKAVGALNLRVGERVAVQVLAAETQPRNAGNNLANTAAGTGTHAASGTGASAGTNAGQTPPAARPNNAPPPTTLMLVEIRGQRVIAEIASGIRPGDQFQARVVSVDGQPTLRRLSPEALNAAASVSGHYRQLTHLARPHADSVRSLARLAAGQSPATTPSQATSVVGRNVATGAFEASANPSTVAAKTGLPPVATDSPGGKFISGTAALSSETAPGMRAPDAQRAQQSPDTRTHQPAPSDPAGRVRSAGVVASGAASGPSANGPATAQSATVGALDIDDIPGLARHLLTRLPDAAALTQPASLRQALADSGTVFEARLARALQEMLSASPASRSGARADTANTPPAGGTGTNPQGVANPPVGGMFATLEQLAKHDLKGALLLIKTLLQRGLPETTAGVAHASRRLTTPGPEASGRTHTVPADALRGAAAQSIDSGRAELARTVEGMQAEIERQQLTQHLAREEGQPRFFELALAPDPRLRRAEVTIGEERKTSNEGISGGETQMTLRLDLGSSGPLLVALRYRVQPDDTQTLNVTLTSPQGAFAERLQTALPVLVAALQDAGITVTQATARQGPVPATLRPQHTPDGLINVRT